MCFPLGFAFYCSSPLFSIIFCQLLMSFQLQLTNFSGSHGSGPNDGHICFVLLPTLFFLLLFPTMACFLSFCSFDSQLVLWAIIDADVNMWLPGRIHEGPIIQIPNHVTCMYLHKPQRSFRICITLYLCQVKSVFPV